MREVDPAFVARLKETAWLVPQGPDEAAFETLYRLRDLERSVVVPADSYRKLGRLYTVDYRKGSAVSDNEVKTIPQTEYVPLATAEHATDTIRNKEKGIDTADHGTGALALLVAERDGAAAIVTRGRQTESLGKNLDLPFWEEMRRMLPASKGLASLHGMFSGKVVDVSDPVEVHAIIGLGKETAGGNRPNIPSREIAERLKDFAAELGLRVVIGNDTSTKTYDPQRADFMRDKDGEVLDKKLAAMPAGSSTNVAYDIMAQHGQQKPALQIEMAALLRLLPLDHLRGWHKDEKARAMGVHLGYLLAKKMVQLIASYPKAA